MKTIAIVILAASLSGCGGPMIFANNGSVNPFEQDQAACQLLQNTDPFAQAYARDPMGNAFYPIMARKNLRACLERKGWKVVESEQK